MKDLILAHDDHDDQTKDRLKGYSIIVPVHNGQETLPDTLRSLLSIDYDAYEIIVVDDASTDNTVCLAEQSGVKVVRLESNRGPAYARNRGAQEAHYDTLLFTDSDVLVPQSILQKLDRNFQESQADAVQGTFSDVCPYANFFSQYKNLYNRYALNQLPEWIGTTFTSVTAVKRNAFLDCGGFDEGIRTASVEDRTLGRHLQKKGYRIRMDRSIEVIHNKKLTGWGFLLNQFRRSRDLAKLLFRNRLETAEPGNPPVASLDESGRYGTNSLSAMVRIPLVYAVLGLAVAGVILPVFFLVSILFWILFLCLIWGFEYELLIRRGLRFFLLGIPVNMMDAMVSGMGIGWGLLEFFMLRRRY